MRESECMSRYASRQSPNHSQRRLCIAWFDAGAVKSGAEEYYGFEVHADETVELTLHHASDSIRFDFYMQTETEEQLLDSVIETMTATNPNTMEDTVYLDIVEDGRIIVKASTSAPFSAYAFNVRFMTLN